MNDTKTKVNQIRILLDEVEKTLEPDEQLLFAHNFDALELPSIVASIVDYLQPLLHPYEAAIYWYLFRKSRSCCRPTVCSCQHEGDAERGH